MPIVSVWRLDYKAVDGGCQTVRNVNAWRAELVLLKQVQEWASDHLDNLTFSEPCGTRVVAHIKAVMRTRIKVIRRASFPALTLEPGVLHIARVVQQVHQIGLLRVHVVRFVNVAAVQRECLMAPHAVERVVHNAMMMIRIKRVVCSIIHSRSHSSQQVVKIAVELRRATDVELDGRLMLNGRDRRVVTIKFIVPVVLNNHRLE